MKKPTVSLKPTGSSYREPHFGAVKNLSTPQARYGELVTEPAQAKSGQQQILHFVGKNCSVCEHQSEVLARSTSQLAIAIDIKKVDVDQLPDLAKQYSAVPGMFVLIDGDGKKKDTWTEVNSLADITSHL